MMVTHTPTRFIIPFTHSWYRRRPQHQREPGMIIGKYMLFQTLGKGSFGKVKVGVDLMTGQKYAIKLVYRDTIMFSLSHDTDIDREIHALKTLDHPNIIKFIDVLQTDQYIAFVLEYVKGGDLFDYMSERSMVQEQEAQRLFAQIIHGVRYMHRKRIVHRDLKLENILMDENQNVVIADFGFANFFERNNDLMATTCGSPFYAAPEVYRTDIPYSGTSVDIWSCGVILYVLLCGDLPFDDDPNNPDGRDNRRLYRYIRSARLTFPSHVSPEAQSLIRHMLVVNPLERYTLDSVIAHPWLRPQQDLFNEPDRVPSTSSVSRPEQGYDVTSATPSPAAGASDYASAYTSIGTGHSHYNASTSAAATTEQRTPYIPFPDQASSSSPARFHPGQRDILGTRQAAPMVYAPFNTQPMHRPLPELPLSPARQRPFNVVAEASRSTQQNRRRAHGRQQRPFRHPANNNSYIQNGPIYSLDSVPERPRAPLHAMPQFEQEEQSSAGPSNHRTVPNTHPHRTLATGRDRTPVHQDEVNRNTMGTPSLHEAAAAAASNIQPHTRRRTTGNKILAWIRRKLLGRGGS